MKVQRLGLQSFRDEDGEYAGSCLGDDDDGDYVRYEDVRAAIEWRPMASAPRDGSPIIVTDGTASDRAAWIGGVWATDLDDTQPCGWLHDEQVIGWMPLPEPMKP